MVVLKYAWHDTSPLLQIQEDLMEKVTLADVNAFLHTGFDAWLITSELVPPTGPRMQYAQAVKRLRAEIAEDTGKQPSQVDSLDPSTQLSEEATRMFLKLREVRRSILSQFV